MKKIKIFLGGYLNSIQAQDLNCRALARYLDKDKFEVYGMLIPKEFEELSVDTGFENVHFIQLNRPARFLRPFCYLVGIYKCDVAYLPKGQLWKFCKLLLKILRKKSFITVEGVIDGISFEKALNFFGSESNIRNGYSYVTKTFSITKYMANINYHLHGIYAPDVLYLGCEVENFVPKLRTHIKLRNIIFIGNDMLRKGANDLLILAARFSDITFHFVGAGHGFDASKAIKDANLQNCVYHGTLSHEKIAELLLSMDLHVLPSRSEGFPKVTLETAAMGVPSVVYSDYGASEWITTGKNGFVVDTLDEMEKVIKELQQNPEKLDNIAKEAIELAKSFDWKVIIKEWEISIENIVRNNA